MTREDIARAITCIDEALIAEAYSKPRPRHLTLRSWAAAAACLVIVAAAVLIAGVAPARVYYCGDQIGSEGAVISAAGPARAVAYTLDEAPVEMTVELELELHGKTKVSVSAGQLELLDVQTGNSLGSGTTITASGRVTALWTLPENPESDSFSLSTGSLLGRTTVTLTQDIEQQCYIVSID